MRYLHAIVLFVALVLPASLAGAAPRPRLAEDVNPVGTEDDEELAMAVAASLRLPAESQAVRQPVMPIVGGAFSGSGGGGLPSVCLSSACATVQPNWTVDQLTEEGQMALAMAESAGVPFVLRLEYLLRPPTRRGLRIEVGDSVRAVAQGYEFVDSPERAPDAPRRHRTDSTRTDFEWPAFGSERESLWMAETRRILTANPTKALFAIAESGLSAKVRSFVMNRGASLTERNEIGETALLRACKNSHHAVVHEIVAVYFELLANQTAENLDPLLFELLNMPDDEGKTPLMYAVLRFDNVLVGTLLAAMRLLHAEVKQQTLEVRNSFEMLNAINNDGYSALGLAKAHLEAGFEGFKSIVQILEWHGAGDMRPVGHGAASKAFC
ncbi:ankyrin repeat domain-containing protein [Candidatus Dependentiae bacterium]|nr:ankyrin repeat domain-containing protein [Candidatus Dependentiae bacterium]